MVRNYGFTERQSTSTKSARYAQSYTQIPPCAVVMIATRSGTRADEVPRLPTGLATAPFVNAWMTCGTIPAAREARQCTGMVWCPQRDQHE